MMKTKEHERRVLLLKVAKYKADHRGEMRCRNCHGWVPPSSGWPYCKTCFHQLPVQMRTKLCSQPKDEDLAYADLLLKTPRSLHLIKTDDIARQYFSASGRFQLRRVSKGGVYRLMDTGQYIRADAPSVELELGRFDTVYEAQKFLSDRARAYLLHNRYASKSLIRRG